MLLARSLTRSVGLLRAVHRAHFTSLISNQKSVEALKPLNIPERLANVISMFILTNLMLSDFLLDSFILLLRARKLLTQICEDEYMLSSVSRLRVKYWEKIDMGPRSSVFALPKI